MFRAKFIAEDAEGNQVLNVDIYTDNPDKKEVESILCKSVEKEGLITSRSYTGVVNWNTKEQDDIASELLKDLSF